MNENADDLPIYSRHHNFMNRGGPALHLLDQRKTKSHFVLIRAIKLQYCGHVYANLRIRFSFTVFTFLKEGFNLIIIQDSVLTVQ
jgi:hypothetical protein